MNHALIKVDTRGPQQRQFVEWHSQRLEGMSGLQHRDVEILGQHACRHSAASAASYYNSFLFHVSILCIRDVI